MEKKCSALITRENKGIEYVIVGDKVGDIVAFDLPTLSKKTFLVGHCATVITDLTFVGDYLASSDRDEKIFVCKFPQTFNIQSICVGHKQFVSCICSVGTHLLSGSADGTIRIWEVESGKCLYQWFLDEVLNIESEEETILIPHQLFSYSATICMAIVEDNPKLIVLDTANFEKSFCYTFDSIPVSITRENNKVIIMTQNLRFYEVQNVKDSIVVTEQESNVYKKSTDEEESGELFKRTVKNRLTTSMGLEKQFEHNKKHKKCE
ncbi:tRNA (guanine-n -)-methyltransferase subunit [Blastocystis sp. subtype 4]|uniref:tRNA (guanine-n -)-methyltransferase subunit n=1 Tax=Blastocystis sp. subtype 4 TaxID=944170 RepID=UPI000711B26F|nr:tRNA (guanine-n -)-methyltransferase subunit [Blastocystis sp. subtype 4]KNB45878.1 tRNA (guanine-n -)-methyltransferase subunit [Blastocystis sp. subtype 4]|eukprot:XP_014529321.1 tRNA (guanine-n -)-methyltransferase subunit [Blastocystis sp. subtype 4]